MADITLQCPSRRALKIAVFLREIEYVLELVHEGKLPQAEQCPEAMERRQEQLLYLARTLEAAVKDQSPELPAHQRPTAKNSKMVWCINHGCERALTREQAKVSGMCPQCRDRAAPTGSDVNEL